MKYTVYITIQGVTEKKRLKMEVEADSDSEATQKAWQRVSVEIKPDKPTGKDMFDKIFKGFK